MFNLRQSNPTWKISLIPSAQIFDKAAIKFPINMLQSLWVWSIRNIIQGVGRISWQAFVYVWRGDSYGFLY